MNHVKYGSVAEIVTAIAAVVGFLGIWSELSRAARDLSFSSVAQYAEFARACRTAETQERSSPSEHINVWRDLCEARVLSYEIITDDVLRATAATKGSLINLESIRQLSIQLEDGLVRELRTKADKFEKTRCKFSYEERRRVQEMFKAVYLLDKPDSTFVTAIEEHNKERSEHAAAFMGFATLVEKIGSRCDAGETR